MSLPRWSPLVPAGLLTALLAAFGGRYGYHRDELYFLEAGHHPAWGYPDQPALVPLLARGWDVVVGGSLWGFRLLPALISGAVVMLAAATCREVGGTSTADAATAAAATATASTLLATGHLFSTTTFDVAATSALVLLLLRALRLGGARPWLVLGAATGLALHIKTLPGVVLACCAVGLVVCGPRRPLASVWPWAASAIALAIAAPVVVWQATHGWPQIALARAIAAGSSGTSVERWVVVPLQALLVGPLLMPLFAVGLLALWRSPQRWLAVAYGVLLVQTVATGGKPYYTMGLVPAVLAASAPVVVRWARDAGRGRRRPALLAGVLAANLVIGSLAVLPWLPARDAQPLVAVNYDLGEQVGWPELVQTVTQASASLPASTVIVAGNYGEAGALSRARRAGAALPPVYSGHNGFAQWGLPPVSATTVLTVGIVRPDVLSACRTVAHLRNRAGIENEENGQPVRVCRHSGAWAADWERLRHLG